MIEPLAFALTAVSGLAALVVLGGLVVSGGYRRAALNPTVVLVQAGLTVQAVADVITQLRGHRPDEFATHVAYLVVSLLLLPLAATETRHDDGPWSAVLLAGAFVVVAVIVTRMAATWR